MTRVREALLQAEGRSAPSMLSNPIHSSEAYEERIGLSKTLDPRASFSARAPRPERAGSAVAAGLPADWLDALPDACSVLRPHQWALIASLREALAQGSRRVLVQAPTGAGKTHVIASLAAAAVAAGGRVVILATRTRLVRQIHERLAAFRVEHGVIAAPLAQLRSLSARVQVASVDTLHARAVRRHAIPLPPAELVIFDEAHLACGRTRAGLLDQYPRALHVGFTATPADIGGRPLRERFDVLVPGPPVASLIESGLLVAPRLFAKASVTEAELRALPHSKDGDYQQGALAQVMGRPRLVGDVVENWLRIAAGRRTLVFACDKAHGAALLEQFSREGVAAELLHDQTPEAEREAALARLAAGRTLVLLNCFLLSYGVDVPAVECIVLARPTRSVVLYLQAIGRGMRPAPGKQHVLVIDHGRVVESLGRPQDDFGWSLDAARNVNREARKAATQRRQSAETTITCPECSHVWLAREEGPTCQHCGWAPAPRPKPVQVTPAELVEMGGKRPRCMPAEVRAVAQQVLGYYAQRFPRRWRETPRKGRGYALRATLARFEPDRVQLPRDFWHLTPTPCSPELAGWLKSRDIAFYRSAQGSSGHALPTPRAGWRG